MDINDIGVLKSYQKYTSVNGYYYGEEFRAYDANNVLRHKRIECVDYRVMNYYYDKNGVLIRHHYLDSDGSIIEDNIIDPNAEDIPYIDRDLEVERERIIQRKSDPNSYESVSNRRRKTEEKEERERKEAREKEERERKELERRHLKHLQNVAVTFEYLPFVTDNRIQEAYLDAAEDYSNIYNT